MNQKPNTRKAGCIAGTIGLILGLVLGFLFDSLTEAATGNRVRRGFATDVRSALIKAFIGGVFGLVGGKPLGEYLGKRTDDQDDFD